MKYTVRSLDVCQDRWLVAAIDTPAPPQPDDPPWDTRLLTTLAVYDVSDDAAKSTVAGGSDGGGRPAHLHRPLEHNILYLTLMLD